MPPIKKGESKEDYVARCTAYVMKHEGETDHKAAAGKCAGMWEQHKKKGTQYDEYQEFTFEVPLESVIVHKAIKELSSSPIKGDNPEVRKTVAMIGDRFMRGQFFSAVELARSASMWESTLHDVNHMGTTYMNGFRPQPNILYFVGWQDNVQYDHESKSLSMDIHPKLNTRYGKDWNAFIELCDEAGRTPNVSISFLGKVRRVRASSLPEGSNYSNYGYKADDMVDYIYDVRPRALSTVLQGLCNDQQGCGIATDNSACETGSCANPPEITPKENKEDAKRRAYLEKRLKKFGGK
jgi:hypothetical protein